MTSSVLSVGRISSPSVLRQKNHANSDALKSRPTRFETGSKHSRLVQNHCRWIREIQQGQHPHHHDADLLRVQRRLTISF